MRANIKHWVKYIFNPCYRDATKLADKANQLLVTNKSISVHKRKSRFAQRLIKILNKSILTRI